MAHAYVPAPASAPRRQLSLTAFLMRYGHHVAAWRHPDTDLASTPFEVYRDVVQNAERACLDQFSRDARADRLDPAEIIS